MDWTDLMAIHGGFEASRMLHAAVAHDLFTHIERIERQTAGPVASQAIAKAANTDPRATELLLNAMTTLGLLTKSPAADPSSPFGAGGFQTTEASRTYLTEGSTQDFRGFIRFDAASWDHWGALPDAIRTGTPAMTDTMFQQDPDATKRFIDAMEAIARARGDHDVVAGRVDVPPTPFAHRQTHILDIGGGSATYSVAFLRKHPRALATIVDLPGTLEVTRSYLEKAPNEIRTRIRLVRCDYNQDPIPPPTDPGTDGWPQPHDEHLRPTKEQINAAWAEHAARGARDGYDMVWISNILHGEDEPRNQRLAATAYDVTRPGGIVAIKEHILDASLTQPANGSLFAINMLLFTAGGRCYGFDEVRRWYEDAGFFDVHEQPPKTPLTSSLVTARRPR